MQLLQETSYDIDYFYRQKKDGSKKVTLYLKNHEESRVFAESHLENICLKIADKWYSTNSLPVLKVMVRSDLKSYSFDEPVGYETVTYDLFSLKTLKWGSLLGKITMSDITETMLYYYYDCACDGFSKKLNSMTLHDIIK